MLLVPPLTVASGSEAAGDHNQTLSLCLVAGVDQPFEVYGDLHQCLLIHKPECYASQ